MVKEIKAYEISDGTAFFDKEEAVKHQRAIDIDKDLDSFLRGCIYDEEEDDYIRDYQYQIIKTSIALESNKLYELLKKYFEG